MLSAAAAETGDTAQPCSTIVAVLKVQQEAPEELCAADQAKVDALREQVLGLLVPYFYSQAVMPDFTAGVLDAKVGKTTSWCRSRLNRPAGHCTLQEAIYCDDGT